VHVNFYVEEDQHFDEEEEVHLDLAKEFLNTLDDEPKDLVRDFLKGDFLSDHHEDLIIPNDDDNVDSNNLQNSPQNYSEGSGDRNKDFDHINAPDNDDQVEVLAPTLENIKKMQL
jgi:hypothetical protein